MAKKLFCALLLTASLSFGRYCLSFDGVNDYISLMDSLYTDTYTWQCWFCPDTFTSADQCLGYFGFSPDFEFCTIHSDGTVSYTTQTGVKVTSGPIGTDRWYHVAVVRTPDSVALFMNGELQEKKPKPANNIYFAGNEIGREGWSGKYFKGKVGGFMMCTAVHYTASFIPKEPMSGDPQTYYLFHCNEGSGNVLYDSSITPRIYALLQGPSWDSVPYIGILKDSLVPVLIQCDPDPTWNRELLFSWHSVEQASYTLQVSQAADFSSIITQVLVADTFYTPPVPLPLGRTYWRVKSSLGGTYSDADSVRIQNDSVPMPVPFDPESVMTRKPLFQWRPGLGADYYRIQIDTSEDFTTPVLSHVLSDTFFSPAADLPLGTIYWRVSADFDETQFSAVDEFIIVNGPGIQRPARQAGPFSVQVFPNPFYSVMRSNVKAFKVFSISGKLVADVQNGVWAPKAAGMGVYFIRFQEGRGSQKKKVLYLK